MKKPLWLFTMILFIFCAVVASPLQATDCDTLKKQIKRERNLLKKKALLNGALEACPQDAEIHYISAYAAERLRKYDRALSSYLKATEIDTTYAKAFFGMGDIYMILGNAESAIRAFTRGLEFKPGSKRARASLELAQIKHKAATGGNITSDEFIRVMEESKKKETTEGAIDGPLLRMQIHFQISSSLLTAEAVQQMAIIGKALESDTLKDKKFEISGHTDNTGTPETNLILSRDRAEAVKQYLIENYKIQPTNLVAAYYGGTRPASPNDSPRNRALNRRVEFKRLSQ